MGATMRQLFIQSQCMKSYQLLVKERLLKYNKRETTNTNHITNIRQPLNNSFQTLIEVQVHKYATGLNVPTGANLMANSTMNQLKQKQVNKH